MTIVSLPVDDRYTNDDFDFDYIEPGKVYHYLVHRYGRVKCGAGFRHAAHVREEIAIAVGARPCKRCQGAS